MASALSNVRLSTAILAATPARGEVVTGRITFPAAAAMVYRSGAVSCRAGGPPDISESIKQAEETCSEDSASGECAAAWDEVEELSAAASHARDKAKDSADPLENYCKENPETDECRTYDT